MRTKTLLFSHTERNICFTRHSISFVELSISILEEHRNIEAHDADAASQAEVPCHCGLHTRSSASDAARNLAEILGCRSVQIGADRFNDLMFLPICAGSPIF